ncbi:polysaccharide deacetylase family protein [Jeongeupia naejangsanensis]|uniref:Polysaccharide deacetylase family protein n=1 Tax=Jeongeupia naejangsanensis TaxID=613195 RepID=A0ABS2BHX8_9NEIS|nr:polysaccharide deacetylase family protein [Jeongeupia naejangsanensis]MBM3115045.1 polysaccharide deacetylase family protein [Jeongeupia naejangsanensis]
MKPSPRTLFCLVVLAVLVLAAVWFAVAWWPAAPPPPGSVAAEARKTTQSVRSPFLDNWDQTPLRKMTQQANDHPGVVWLEGLTHRRQIALTFDDGPSPWTPDLLDVLKKHQVKATFFWLGGQMAGREDIVRRALAEGHTLANHSWSHPNLAGTDESYFWNEEIGRTQSEFRRIIGKAPTLMRPPYGNIDDAQIGIVDKHGMKVVLWSIDAIDWYRNRMLFGAHEIERGVQPYVHEEAIVLMHDGGGKRGDTVAAVDRLIPWLKSGGYSFATVDALLGVPPYFPEPQAH